MKLKNKIILLFCLLLTFYSCNTTEPVDNKQISLSVEDVSCTEAWLKVSSSVTGSVIITKDENPAKTINLNKVDTICLHRLTFTRKKLHLPGKFNSKRKVNRNE